MTGYPYSHGHVHMEEARLKRNAYEIYSSNSLGVCLVTA